MYAYEVDNFHKSTSYVPAVSPRNCVRSKAAAAQANLLASLSDEPSQSATLRARECSLFASFWMSAFTTGVDGEVMEQAGLFLVGVVAPIVLTASWTVLVIP